MLGARQWLWPRFFSGSYDVYEPNKKYSNWFFTSHINHHKSSSIIINHHQSSSIIINHHQSSSVIINHHQSSSIIINQNSSYCILKRFPSSFRPRPHRPHLFGFGRTPQTSTPMTTRSDHLCPRNFGDVFPQGSLGSCRSLWFFVWLNAGLMVSWWCGLINVDVS